VVLESCSVDEAGGPEQLEVPESAKMGLAGPG